MRKKLISGVFVLLLFLSSGRASGQHYSSSIAGTYEINVNVTYLTIGGWEGKLDVYSRSDTPGPHPTMSSTSTAAAPSGRSSKRVSPA